ncbi:hypothetical protein ABMA28_011992 [Loxostege sticticalis]|uniref:Regulatory protein zeste n=1 Tax=Loxostege sticticalis TaxID=481309 RepID=A0ABD0TL78_LOXSC
MSMTKENRPPKRQRSENWLEEDKYLLKELVKERVNAIENKNTDTNTNKRKVAAWADLQTTFNSMCAGMNRSITQLKSQWSLIKISAKKDKTIARQAQIKTGGGPPLSVPDDRADDIASWLPNEFVVDVNRFDSDSNKSELINIQEEESTQNTQDQELINNEEIQYELVVLDEEIEDTHACTTRGILEEKENKKVEAKENKAKPNFKAPAIKKKRKLLNKEGLIDLSKARISEIAETESKCRIELHEVQMENERKKGRNLDLEHQLLQEKLKYYTQINKE